ncbi:MAG: NAD(P)H-hydrate dehydratase [Planctomycetota bacterium]|jgi:NAD(P)H-hydrate epimerase|nr:NAD(P)H-hydrate dehydratase [Planctomycetales bacterium]RLT04621.1 MAG: NAD(P)H-hydrate dehydratase [Planctomycetota bacterium]
MSEQYITEQVPMLPDRPQDGHKGTFGKVLIIGGSIGMSGAVCLSSVSALRSGSGLVTAAIPRSIQMTVAAYEPCVMTIGLETDCHGQLASLSRERIAELLAGKDAVALGPGLGQSPEVTDLVSLVLEFCRVPLVLDADALNAVAMGGLWAKRDKRSACVITPHPGEFARLTGLSIPDDEDTRIKMSADFARTHQLTVVLKGPRTVVTNGTRLFVNATGNSGMATAGSGDVLTGIVASLLGQKMHAFEAAALAVNAHGRAGNFAAFELGQRGMIASDLMMALPKSWKQMEVDQNLIRSDDAS